jgi:HEAT repeat protein
MVNHGLVTDQQGVPDLRRFSRSAETYYRLHLDALREQNFQKRVEASWGLIARGSDSLPFLTLMLKSRAADSREDASGVLSWLGKSSTGMISDLLSALERETEQQPRDGIVLALGGLKNRAAIPALAQLIRSSDIDGDTRRCAVESLGKIVRKRFDKQIDPEAAAIAWLDREGS